MNMNEFPRALLSIDTNAKTVKGAKFGFKTGILYFAPADISGKPVCAMAAIAGCKKACLFTAGRGKFTPVQNARIRKTQLFFSRRDEFMSLLVRDVMKLEISAAHDGLTPLVRLNGTSDIKWENIPVVRDGVTYANIMLAFPDVQFYDYTKIANRKNLPANYDLTYSYSGTVAYLPYVEKAIKAGMRIAAVFRTVADIPANFMGLECIGGDDSDIRHLEPKNVVVALYAKGKAIFDTTGFVVDALRTIPLMPVAA